MKKITDLTLQSLSEAQKKEIKGGRWKIEAIHVGAAIKSGATLVHGTMMMNKVNKLEM